MRQVNVWLCATLVVLAIAGTLLLTGQPPWSKATAAAAAPPKEHWEYHDGHWCYWDPVDTVWYYTDGSHWFYDDHDHWRVYHFDRHLGKEGFVHGEYRAPREEERIVVPHHKHPR
jgi:hypothetical protein